MNAVTKRWLIVIGLLVLASLIAIPMMRSTTKGNQTATIRLNQDIVQHIDLASVLESYQLKGDAPNGGYNVIDVRPGEIEVIEADCPDQICVHQGAISDGAEPIVCLPHKLVIEIGPTVEEELKPTPDAVTK